MGNARKGKFENSAGEIKAMIEEVYPVTLNDNVYTSIVRTVTHDILIHGVKCMITVQSYVLCIVAIIEALFSSLFLS